jgi:hypothetical protein
MPIRSLSKGRSSRSRSPSGRFRRRGGGSLWHRRPPTSIGAREFEPITVKAQTGPLRTVLANSGYVSEDNFARADAGGLRRWRRWPKTPAGTAAALPSGPAPGQAPRHRRCPAAPAASAWPRRLQDAGPHRGTSIRATQDLPELHHDVPARLHRVRKRIASTRLWATS